LLRCLATKSGHPTHIICLYKLCRKSGLIHQTCEMIEGTFFLGIIYLCYTFFNNDKATRINVIVKY